MGDALLALSVPLLILASGVHAACDRRRRRRHPAPPSPYTRQAHRLAAQDALLRAGAVIDGAYTCLGGFYESPAAPRPAPAAPRVSGGAEPNRGHGPSRPAPARRR